MAMQENKPNWNRLLNQLMNKQEKHVLFHVAKDLYHTWFKSETISNTGLHRKELKK